MICGRFWLPKWYPDFVMHSLFDPQKASLSAVWDFSRFLLNFCSILGTFFLNFGAPLASLVHSGSLPGASNSCKVFPLARGKHFFGTNRCKVSEYQNWHPFLAQTGQEPAKNMPRTCLTTNFYCEMPTTKWGRACSPKGGFQLNPPRARRARRVKSISIVLAIVITIGLSQVCSKS